MNLMTLVTLAPRHLKTQRFTFGLAAAVFVFLGSQPSQAALKEGALECPVIRPIAQGFLAHHVSARKLDLEHEGRTIERFIKGLDPSKMYLLSSDVQEIRGLLRGIFKKLGEDCAPLDKAHQIYLKRINAAYEVAKRELEDPNFKFLENTEIMLNSDKRSFANNEKEFQEQLSKFMQFQLSNYLASDMKLAQAKTQLLHRYELNAKRQNDFKRSDLYAMFLDSIASALDAHSGYLAADTLEDFEISMRLSLEGIGAALSWEDGYTKIENLIPGGTAERSGEIQPNDKIISVAQGDGPFEQVIDMPLRDVVKLIRGKKGTVVRLTLLRQSPKETERKVVSLKRDKIKLEDEAAKLYFSTRKVDGKTYKIGIIDLPSFYGDLSRNTRSCYDDLKKLITKANKEKVDALVLDLSKNGGGLLTEAVRIGGLFIRRGNIVATENARGAVEMLPDEDDSVVYRGPLAVLTSRLSASASEIVAGALQDYKRAIIVGGDHTFGKGTVQAMMNLPSNLGAIKVTTGMFFVPGGHSTQYRGVPADVVLPSIFSTKDIGENSLDYSLPPKKRDSFLSADANSNIEPWRAIDANLIKRIQALSETRISKDPEFKKIREEVAEQEQKMGLIKLADSLKKQREEKKDPKSKRKQARRRSKQSDEDYLKAPQVAEALNVAADLAHLSK
jgi:carboxyl-terminal processing protease